MTVRFEASRVNAVDRYFRAPETVPHGTEGPSMGSVRKNAEAGYNPAVHSESSNHARASPIAMILSFLAKKGGVAKTTSAVSLAAAYAKRGHRVLVIDLDSQASASLSLGLERRDFAPSSADVLLGRASAREARRSTAVPGLEVIPASSDLLGVDLELGGLRHKERRLLDRLDGVRDEHDLILIDCPPSLSLLPVNALVASDAFIVPLVPQYLAWEGLDNLLGAAERLSARVGSKTRLLGLLLTMVDYRVRSVRENVEAIRNHFGALVLAVEIRVNTRLAEAPRSGRTIFDFDPGSVGARAYGLLADELAPRLGLETSTVDLPSSPFEGGS